MSKRPFLLLYINDFLSAATVTVMDDNQFAWYLRLLMRAWQFDPACCLPNDDAQLMMYAGCKSKKLWDQKKGLVLSNFDPAEDPKFLTNERLQKEYRKMCAISDKRAEAARLKAAKHLQNSANAEMCTANAVQNAATQTLTQTLTKPKAKASPVATLSFPDWLPVEPWKAFLEMRQRIRKPITPYAMERIIAKLDRYRSRGQPPEQVLDQSTVNGWQDVYELKQEYRNHQPQLVPKPAMKSVHEVMRERGD